MSAALRPPPFLLLVALTSASPFAMNAMLPALPAMQTDFRTSYAVVQLALTLALICFGCAQLVLGPLSDRFGRRPVVLAGFSLFVLGSLVSALATSAEVMILGRMIQSTGGSAGVVLGRTIAHDVYGRGGAAGAIGYLTMAMALSQILAPTLGGLIDQHIGWPAIFWLLTIVGAALLAATFARLHETNEAVAPGTPRRSLLGDAAELVRMREYLGLAGHFAFASGMFFAFAANGPYVVETLMGASQSTYGLYNALPAIGYAVGNFVSGRYSTHFGAGRLMWLGVAVGAAAVAMLWLLEPWHHPLAVFLPMALVAVSNGLSMPSAMAGAMGLAPRLAGAASGIAGAMQMLLGALVGFAVGVYLDKTSEPVLIGVTLTYLLSVGCLIAARRPSA